MNAPQFRCEPEAPVRHKVALVLVGDCWCVRHESADPQTRLVLEAFGTRTVPTPWRYGTPWMHVRDTLRTLNPGWDVEVQP